MPFYFSRLIVGVFEKTSCRRSPSIRLMLLSGCLMFLATGCLHRRMTIRSDPPGAQVLVDGEDVGYTPASVDFNHYGTREITLVKDGYETLTTLQKVRTPWYQYVPLDFVTDNFLPFQLTNRHDFRYKLRPSVIVPTEELLGRGQYLRSEAQLGQ